MTGAPRSEIFDDVYFSAQDGLAETRHVFLKGNNLPKAWEGRERFSICETGFGTGLNFLAAWKLFEETAVPGQRLDFISVEKYPLSAAQIEAALSPWDTELFFLPTFPKESDSLLLRAILCKIYSKKEQGESILKPAENVTLRLLFDDVNTAMPQLEAQVDCWFLDGFKPSSNPEMWSETVFENMARLSKPGASFATFTAAGDVRRGLETVGFDVQKVSGFGSKREMLVGSYDPSSVFACAQTPSPMGRGWGPRSGRVRG